LQQCRTGKRDSDRKRWWSIQRKSGWTNDQCVDGRDHTRYEHCWHLHGDLHDRGRRWLRIVQHDGVGDDHYCAERYDLLCWHALLQQRWPG